MDKITMAKKDVLARFGDPGPNRLHCAQAVLRFALLVAELDPDLVVAARYLGGGVARMGETCGALTGAALALGLRDCERASPNLERTVEMSKRVQDLLRGFAAEFGSCRCRELTGYDLSTPEKYEVFRKSEAHIRCGGYVGWVCDRLAHPDG